MLLYVLVLCLQLSSVSCLDCYQCENIADPADCHDVKPCPNGTDIICSVESTTVDGQKAYNLSCKHRLQCPGVTTIATTPNPTSPYTGSLPTGRTPNPTTTNTTNAISTNTNTTNATTSIVTTASPSNPDEIIGRRRRAAGDEPCSECCSKNACNKDLCFGSANVTTVCSDDPSVDCFHIDTLFGICKDTQHAKLSCRKYCKLCDLKDGAWSGWSDWSDCDVTCSNGTNTRTRKCDNPAPAHGGSNCTGPDMEKKGCQQTECPVDGDWSAWTTWKNCSVSCGIGLQTRRRNCSNPYPDRFGQHCFGDSLDVKPCFLRACADGGWSDWSNWGTCDGGIQNRTRSCDNPSPSKLGRDCPGNDKDVQACPGGSNTASVTPTVVFKALNVSNMNTSASFPIRYITTLTNVGGAYNTTSGKFTAPYDGLYSFTIQMCSNTNEMIVQLMAGGKVISTVHQYDGNGQTCTTGDGMADLKTGDEVWVSKFYGRMFQDSFSWNTFSGMLIHQTV